MFLENESGKIPKKRRELFEKSYFNFRHVGKIFLEKKRNAKISDISLRLSRDHYNLGLTYSI